MAGNSRFGRRSPVERSGRSPDSEPSCSRLISGSKRSVQDRLETREGDPSTGRSYKRFKGEYNQERHQSNDGHLAKGDLRLEIIKMRDPSTDLRAKLSNKFNIVSANVPENPRQNVENKSYIDVDKKKNMEDMMPDFKGSSRGQCIGRQSDSYNTERPIMERSRDSYRDAKRQNIHKPWGNYNGHGGPSYPSLALDIPIQRPPARILSSTIVRALSPDRNLAQQRETIRQYDDGRSQLHRSHEFPGPYMPAGPPMHMRPPPLNALPPPPFPQPVLTNQNPVGQPPIDGFLQSIGLEKYSYHFHQEEVDFNALAHMTDGDLKELKIPMGPRKRILQALLPPPRRR